MEGGREGVLATAQGAAQGGAASCGMAAAVGPAPPHAATGCRSWARRRRRRLHRAALHDTGTHGVVLGDEGACVQWGEAWAKRAWKSAVATGTRGVGGLAKQLGRGARRQTPDHDCGTNVRGAPPHARQVHGQWPELPETNPIAFGDCPVPTVSNPGAGPLKVMSGRSPVRIHSSSKTHTLPTVRCSMLDPRRRPNPRPPAVATTESARRRGLQNKCEWLHFFQKKIDGGRNT